MDVGCSKSDEPWNPQNLFPQATNKNFERWIDSIDESSHISETHEHQLYTALFWRKLPPSFAKGGYKNSDGRTTSSRMHCSSGGFCAFFWLQCFLFFFFFFFGEVKNLPTSYSTPPKKWLIWTVMNKKLFFFKKSHMNSMDGRRRVKFPKFPPGWAPTRRPSDLLDFPPKLGGRGGVAAKWIFSYLIGQQKIPHFFFGGEKSSKVFCGEVCRVITPVEGSMVIATPFCPVTICKFGTWMSRWKWMDQWLGSIG